MIERALGITDPSYSGAAWFAGLIAKAAAIGAMIAAADHWAAHDNPGGYILAGFPVLFTLAIAINDTASAIAESRKSD